MITVVVADDHPVYREGLVNSWSELSSIKVVGSAADGNSAFELICEHQPTVAVVDLRLPAMDGIEVLTHVRRESIPTAVLILTAYVDRSTVYRAFSLGANGFLEKVASFSEITDAVVRIGAGGTVMAPFAQEVLAKELQFRSTEGDQPSLTAREVEILQLATRGLASSEIGQELHISLATVKSHLQRIYEKLGVSDRAAAVAKAIRSGILD